MLMMIEIDSKQISEQDQDILLHQVWESSIDEGTSFDQYIYLQLMNFHLIETLIETTNFQIIFEICGMRLSNYQYVFHAFLDRLADIYAGVNHNKNFEITMVGQGFELFFQVFDQGDTLLIKAYDFSGKDRGNEVITKSEFKKVIDQIKNQYSQMINEYFDERFHFYNSSFNLYQFQV